MDLDFRVTNTEPIIVWFLSVFIVLTSLYALFLLLTRKGRFVSFSKHVVLCLLIIPFSILLSSCMYYGHYVIDTSHFSNNFIDNVLKEGIYTTIGGLETEDEKMQLQILNYINKKYTRSTQLTDENTELTSVGSRCEKQNQKALDCLYLQYWHTPMMNGKKEIVFDLRTYACIVISSRVAGTLLKHDVNVNSFPNAYDISLLEEMLEETPEEEMRELCRLDREVFIQTTIDLLDHRMISRAID